MSFVTKSTSFLPSVFLSLFQIQSFLSCFESEWKKSLNEYILYLFHYFRLCHLPFKFHKNGFSFDFFCLTFCSLLFLFVTLSFWDFSSKNMSRPILFWWASQNVLNNLAVAQSKWVYSLKYQLNLSNWLSEYLFIDVPWKSSPTYKQMKWITRIQFFSTCTLADFSAKILFTAEPASSVFECECAFS
jgi:hypothetical protein